MDYRTRVGFGAELASRSLVIFNGYITLQPDISNTVYDYIIDSGSGFIKVQVKASAPCERGRIKVDTRKSHGKSRNYSSGDFDILSIVNSETGKVCFLDWMTLGTPTAVILWENPPKSRNGYGANEHPLLFHDYTDVNKAVISVLERRKMEAS